MNIMIPSGSYIGYIDEDTVVRYVDIAERGLETVTRTGGASGIEEPHTVLISVKSFVSMTEEDDIAAVFAGDIFEMLEGASYAVLMTVSCEDLVIACLENEEVWTETVVVAVSGNVYYLRRERRMRSYEAVELCFTVTEVEDPVGVGIAHNYAFKVSIITVGVRNNNNTHRYAPENFVMYIITQIKKKINS